MVSPFTVKYLRRRAPDFFDWQSGIFEFKDSREVLVEKVKEYFLDNYKKFREMTPRERMLQALQIREFLEDATLPLDDGFRLLLNLGIVQNVMESFQDAEISWSKALDTAVSTAENLDLRGQLLDVMERYEEAIASYDKALEIKPNKDSAWYNRGISLHDLGRYEEAIASDDKALEIKPDYELAKKNRRIAFARKTLSSPLDVLEAWLRNWFTGRKSTR